MNFKININRLDNASFYVFYMKMGRKIPKDKVTNIFASRDED